MLLDLLNDTDVAVRRVVAETAVTRGDAGADGKSYAGGVRRKARAPRIMTKALRALRSETRALRQLPLPAVECRVMSYEWDVFISYRRRGEWPKWVHDIFIPLLDHWLGEELGRDPEIFVDQRMESGSAWPYDLARAHGTSRVLIALWSKQYFNSAWCVTELSLMREREVHCGLGTVAQPGGLVVPASIHDGDSFPADARIITYRELQEYTNVRLAQNSPTEERLSDSIRDWAPDIARAIDRAPAFDPAWTGLAANAFMVRFSTPAAQQTQVPSLGAA